MTVREAAVYLDEPASTHLRRWGETFGIPLNEFHIGHVRTYQADRIREVEAAIVDREIAAFLMLLRKLNLSSEIERLYTPIVGHVKQRDDGRCLYREHFVKKDGTISRLKRQCPRLAYIDKRGRVDRYCGEHRTASLDEMRRALDRTKPRVSYVPGPKIIQ